MVEVVVRDDVYFLEGAVGRFGVEDVDGGSDGGGSGGGD